MKYPVATFAVVLAAFGFAIFGSIPTDQAAIGLHLTLLAITTIVQLQVQLKLNPSSNSLARWVALAETEMEFPAVISAAATERRQTLRQSLEKLPARSNPS